MPPVVPPYKLQARKRMVQAMLPQVAAARDRQNQMRRQPMNPGAEQQQQQMSQPGGAEQAMRSDQRAAAQARLLEGLHRPPTEQTHQQGNPIIGRLPAGYGPGGQPTFRPRPKQPRPLTPSPGEGGLLQRMRRQRF